MGKMFAFSVFNYKVEFAFYLVGLFDEMFSFSFPVRLVSSMDSVMHAILYNPAFSDHGG